MISPVQLIVVISVTFLLGVRIGQLLGEEQATCRRRRYEKMLDATEEKRSEQQVEPVEVPQLYYDAFRDEEEEEDDA